MWTMSTVCNRHVTLLVAVLLFSGKVLVLEDRPRGSSRTNFQVLVLVFVLVLGSSSPQKFSGIE